MPFSDWQDGFAITITVFSTHSAGARQTVITRDHPAGVSAADLQSALDTVLGHLRSGVTDFPGCTLASDMPGSIFGAYFNGQPVNPATPFVGGAGFGYEIAHFDGDAALVDAALDNTPSLPPDAAPLPSGYPNSNSWVQYESDSSVFDLWEDAGVNAQAEIMSWDDLYASQPPSVQGSASPPPTSLDLEFGYAASVSLTGGLPLWSTLTDLGSASLPTEVTSGPYAPYSALGPRLFDITTDPSSADADGGSHVIAIPASDVSLSTFDLVVMPGQADADGYTVPSGLSGSGETWSWEVALTSSGPVAGFGLLFALRLTMHATTPRWRYWIEDDKLRTVGDHFRSAGGADIKSLIPGVGWVKVRPGP